MDILRADTDAVAEVLLGALKPALHLTSDRFDDNIRGRLASVVAAVQTMVLNGGPDGAPPPARWRPGRGGWRDRGRGIETRSEDDHVTVPPGTGVRPGEALRKVWRVRNGLDEPWPDSVELIMVNPRAVPNQFGVPPVIPVRGGVPPGGELDVAVDLVAPADAGLFQGFFRLATPAGVRFGQRLGVSIVVATESDLEPMSETGEGSASSSSEPPPDAGVAWPTETALLEELALSPADHEHALWLLARFNGNLERVLDVVHPKKAAGEAPAGAGAFGTGFDAGSVSAVTSHKLKVISAKAALATANLERRHAKVMRRLERRREKELARLARADAKTRPPAVAAAVPVPSPTPAPPPPAT